MNRRQFIGTGLAAGSLAAAGSLSTTQAQNQKPNRKFGRFHLKYAPHFGMFQAITGPDKVDQLKFIADQGFVALEDNGMMGRPVDEQEKLAKAMTGLGIEMGVFVAYKDFANPTLSSGDKNEREKAVAEMKKAVECAKRVNAKWCTVVPGCIHPKLHMDYQTANVIEALKQMAEVCEQSGLVMVLEPLNHHTNHPGLFLTRVPQGYLICKSVDSPSCKILDDLYHQQITEGNLIPNMDMAWSEIAYFQVGDNPGRKEPTTGEINYKNIFKHLYQRGYTGIVGMEHGNSQRGEEGAMAVIEAYQKCDDFEV
jgi:hydroxypyruvate isomerase